jgi:hypothetical protein
MSLRKREKLAEEEQSLKDKYKQLRKLQKVTICLSMRQGRDGKDQFVRRSAFDLPSLFLNIKRFV